MNLILVTVVILAFFILFSYLGRGTIHSLVGNPWGVIFYKEIAFIVPAVFFVLIFGVDSFQTFRLAEKEHEVITSWLVIYSILTFLLISVLMKAISLGGASFSMNEELIVSGRDQLRSFCNAVMISVVIVILVSFIFLGYQHAFLEAIIRGRSILEVRLQNKYQSSLPSQVAYIISLANVLLTIYSVYLSRYEKRIYFILVYALVLFVATADGAKASFLDVFIVTAASYLYFYRPKINLLKVVLYTLFGAVFLFFSLFYSLSLQTQGLEIEAFLVYLIERIGVGQMAGMYETVSANFINPSFTWHMIPFSSFFIDYPIYSKELMMLSEGSTYEGSGVKNSLFMAEAFSMGGWYLAIASPFIFSIGYFIKLVIIHLVLSRFFGSVVSRVFSLPILFSTTALTGDFSSIALQKGTILLVLTLGMFYVVKLSLNLLIIRRSL